MPTITDYRQQWRRDTAANLASDNPTLAAGEPVLETDTLKVKIGDGSTAYNSLGYFGEGNLQWSDLIGCQCIPGTDSDHDIDITAGKRRDSTDTVDLTCPAATAAIDATFDAGTSTWGLYSGASLSAGDTVHLMVISIDAGGAGYYFDDDITGANLPSGCTYFRRIASRRMVTSTTIAPAKQFGNYSELITMQQSVLYSSGYVPTTQTSVELPDIPKGKSFGANLIFTRYYNYSTKTSYGSPDTTIPTPVDQYACLQTESEVTKTSVDAIVRTDTNAQIDIISSLASGWLAILTRGWYDDLGAFDGT